MQKVSITFDDNGEIVTVNKEVNPADNKDANKGDGKVTKVTLTLNDKGQITGVKPEGKTLKIDGKILGKECKCEGEIEFANSAAILCKPGNSPCCIVSGGQLWCWC